VKAIAVALFALLVIAPMDGAPTPVSSAAKKRRPKKRRRRPARWAPVRVSAATRAKAVDEVTHELAEPLAFDNPAGLIAFFESLYQTRLHNTPVHVLQFGDSHTASDDWVNSMRQLAQAKFGDGGPGFVFPGHPFPGFRRYDARGSSSSWWHTDGTTGSPGDGRVGLGISIEADRADQTASLEAAGARTELYYLQETGGGSMEISAGETDPATVVASGDAALGTWMHDNGPGVARFTVGTLSSGPVRLLGWAVDNPTGITWETLGINGAQMGIINGWDDTLFDGIVQSRAPALVILAYGTNEALSPRFSTDEYRETLRSAIRKIRKATPVASILIVGPPDCYLRRWRHLGPFPWLDQVIEVQRKVAIEEGCAFWDWRQRMGGPGSKHEWVVSGYAQPDYVHFTGAGYDLLGKALFSDLMLQYDTFLKVREEPQNEQPGQNQGNPESGVAKP